jgi:type I restriction enzyme R subunit
MVIQRQTKELLRRRSIGTSIEKTDANTGAVFGDYISIYDIQRAVADKATVPIDYEGRI